MAGAPLAALVVLAAALAAGAVAQEPAWGSLAPVAYWNVCVQELAALHGVTASTGTTAEYAMFAGPVDEPLQFEPQRFPEDAWMVDRNSVAQWASSSSNSACSGSAEATRDPARVVRYFNLTLRPEMLEAAESGDTHVRVTLIAHATSVYPRMLVSIRSYDQLPAVAATTDISIVIESHDWDQRNSSYTVETQLDTAGAVNVVEVTMTTFTWADDGCILDVTAALVVSRDAFESYVSMLNVLEVILLSMVLLVPLLLIVVAPGCKPAPLVGHDLLLDSRTPSSRWVVLVIYALSAQMVFTIVMDVTIGLVSSVSVGSILPNYAQVSLVNLNSLALTWEETIRHAQPNLVPVVSFLFSIFRMFLVCVMYWPLLLSYANRHRIIGCVCGMTTAMSLFAYRMSLRMLEKLFFSHSAEAEQSFYLTLPELVGLPLLALYFLFRLGVIIRNIRFYGDAGFMPVEPQAPPVDPRIAKHIGHVRKLLVGKRKMDEDESDEAATTMRSKLSVAAIGAWIRRKLRRAAAIVIFPQRIVVSVAIVTSLLWDLAVYISFWMQTIIPKVSCSLSVMDAYLPLVREMIATGEVGDFNADYTGIVRTAWSVAEIIADVTSWALALALAGSLLQLTFLLRASLYDLAKLRKGDYSGVPFGRRHQLFIYHALMYIGFQTGFSFIGFVILCTTLIFILSVVATLRYIPSVQSIVWDYLISRWFFASVLIILAFWLLQMGFTWVVFTYRRNRFWLRARAVFQQYDYFTTYINIIQGVFAFLFRIIASVVFLILFCYRLDMSTLGEFGIAFIDQGHLSYMGVILTEHHYMNSVSLVFFHLLEYNVLLPPNIQRATRNIQRVRALTTSSEGNLSHYSNADTENPWISASDEARRRRLRNRVWLAITLSNNPDLIPLRKHHMSAASTASVGGSLGASSTLDDASVAILIEHATPGARLRRVNMKPVDLPAPEQASDVFGEPFASVNYSKVDDEADEV